MCLEYEIGMYNHQPGANMVAVTAERKTFNLNDATTLDDGNASSDPCLAPNWCGSLMLVYFIANNAME